MRSKRRRRTIASKMESPTNLKVTAPWRASNGSIRSVIGKQINWIKRRLLQLAQAKKNPKTSEFRARRKHDYLGYPCRLSVSRDNDLPQGCLLRPHHLQINLHPGELSAANAEEETRLELLFWLKKRAKTKMQSRMDYWAKRLGVSYGKLIIANAEHRWGSCNAQNVIRLNWRLIMAPLPILDYVVVHELCHVRHKNHGPKFWNQVASVWLIGKNRRNYLRLMGAGLTL